MKLEQSSYSVDNVIQFKQSIKDHVNHRNIEEQTTVIKDKVIGGILSDSRYSWLACGSRLEVLHTRSGTKVAAWSFRSQHDFETEVSCVADLASTKGKAPLLVVGLECEITGGMVCVFDIGSSRVVRAIQINDKVTSIEVVSTGCDNSLPGVLSALDGIIAVGTCKGKILLIDLCRQICEEAISNNSDEIIRDEINSCHLINLSFDDLRTLERHKERSVNKGDHLCLQLNESSTSGVHFSLYGPDGSVRLRASMCEVVISCLHFAPALGALLVGYNFGTWQLYNIISTPFPTLDYTSPMYEDCIPVAHFTVQEPCDDPRAFCYVWAAYSLQDSDIQDTKPATSIAVMYALTYQAKEYLEGYGMLYQDLSACSVRFQVEFASIVNGHNKNTAARCLSLRSYTRPVTQDAPEERLALCGLVWTCWDTSSSTATHDTYLALFDLNQWYKEQMPSEPHSTHERYMVCVSVTELMVGIEVKCATDEIIDLRLDSSSLNPFTSPQRLEEHYYPSALAFRSVCISSRHLAWIRSSGVQRHLLSQLELAGPLCLLQPADLYHRCVALGLCPAYTDIPANPNSSQQRAYVLSVALEHQLVRWLCRCARDWAGGAQAVAGCTIDSLLEWAWQRANALKFSCDKLCVPLFDHTGERLDSNALSHLNHAACQLKHLTTLFDTVLQSCHVYFSQQDLDDIRYQYNSLEMISTYMEVLQWLLNVGLLPECPMYMYPRVDESERMSAPYPVESLTQFYTKRRKELCGSDDCPESLLFIDQLVERECGGSLLCKQWECDGGSGLYPPPSLQALLRTYLIEGIDIKHKHCLFIYVFLDLAMTLDQSRYKSIITHLIKFPAVFKLSPSIIKMTQAFWQLDHGDFSTAMAQLLDPAVTSEDLKPWHHRTVLKALLLQGQHQHALLYHQVRKPPVSSVQDICIIITLLIVNDLLQEAFHFQRQNRNVYNEKKIVKHFFAVSHKMNQLTNILYLPLNRFEENAFISYLQANPADTNDILQVIYYLQRDRYEEAFRLNDRINVLHKNIVKHGLLGQQERNFRNVMVSGFKKTLPQFTQVLLDLVNQQREAFKQHKWKEIERPTPMSVMIHNTEKEAKYKSTIIQASFQKAKETWTFQEKENETPFLSTPKALPTTEKCEANSLIYTSMMQPMFPSTDIDDFESEATPAKRIRLSPRQPISSTSQSSQRLSLGQSPSRSLLETPIVKRKSYRAHDTGNQPSPIPSVVGTPTSILKVRSFIRQSISPDVSSIGSRGLRGTSTTPEVLEEEQDKETDNGVIPLDSSTANVIKSVGINFSASPSIITQRRRSPLGVSPRRPITRTPRPAVHFEDLGRPNSRSSDGSATDAHTSRNLEVRIEVHREQTPDLAPSSKDSSRSIDDVFYSPDTSITDQRENTIENGNDVASHIRQLDAIEAMDVVKPSTVESPRHSLKRKASDSVKSRRSYKPVTPSKVEFTRNIRESLRSSDSPLVNKEPSSSTTPLASPKPEEPSPKRDFHKISGRRSLSRQVLEHNTLTRAMQQPKMQTRLSTSHIPVIEHVDDKTVGIEVSYSKTVTSIVKTTSNNHSEERCDKSTLELKNVFTTEKDPETSAQIIKHVHNESTSKSSLKKVTDMTDDTSADDEELAQHRKSDYHVLSFSSDIDDSVVQKSYQNWEKENDSFLTSSKTDLCAEKQQDKDETQMNVDESMEDVSEQLDINEEKKDNLTETVFEDISSIIEESFASEESEHEVIIEDEPESSKSNQKTETEVEQHNEEVITNTEENTNASTESEEKMSNQSEESIDVVEVEVERNSISSDSEPENCLVPSSEEDSSDEKEEIASEQVEEEQEDESSDEESKEASELESESSNSDVIEIKSSSEESMEELKLNQSNELVENEEDSNEKVAISEDSKSTNELISELDENYADDLQMETGVTQVETVTDDVPMEQEVHECVQVPAEEIPVNINVTKQEIITTNIPVTESQVTIDIQSSEHQENKITEQVINQGIIEDESLEIPEDIREELEESEQIIKLEKSIPQAVKETPQETNENVTEERTVANEPIEPYTPSRRSQRISSKQERKKNDEETPKKITRRRSVSTDVVEPKSPARVTRRSTSIDVNTTSPARVTRRTRSTSVDVEPLEKDKPTRVQTRRSSTKSTESKEPEPEELPKRSTRASSVSKLPIIEEESRKTRASSVESTTSQRSKRGSSLEPKPSSPARRGRKRSIQADVIPEEQPDEDKATQAALEKIPEKIEEYSATHRLTRRQKMIMEKSLEIQEMKKLQTPEIKPKIKSKHDDKDAGSPDRTSSPASSVGTHSTAPSTPKRRSVRRNSTSTNTPGTPRRSTRASSKDTSDDVSSVCSVPVVQLEKLEMTRHRSLSPNAFKESAVPSPRTRRKSSRNSVITGRTDLTKISEESVEIDTASSEKPTSSQETKTKRGRSKKTDNVDSQSSQSSESPPNKNTSPKSTSYRPLEEYVPKYSAFKTRKSFKIKKLTRGKTH